MRTLFTLGFFWIALGFGQGAAADLDIVYERSDSRNWGQRLAQALGIGNKPKFGKSYAFIVVISDFKDGHFDDLRTQNDAERMFRYFRDYAEYDYVRLLTDAEATKQKIESIIEDDLSEAITSDDRFVFYWSGHGITREKNGRKFGYLPLSNSESARYSSMIDMEDIADWDEKIEASQILYLLDSCFSGLAGGAAKSDIQRDLSFRQFAGPARHIMTAGTEGQKSWVIDKYGGSAFTTVLLEGLSGAADRPFADGSTDGLVTISELESYVSRNTRRILDESGLKRVELTPQRNDLDYNRGRFFFKVPDRRFDFGTNVQLASAVVSKSAADTGSPAVSLVVARPSARLIGEENPGVAVTSLRDLGLVLGGTGGTDQSALQRFDYTSGSVVIGASGSSKGAMLGFRKNDVIVDIDGQKIADAGDVRTAIDVAERSGGAILNMTFVRGESLFRLNVPVVHASIAGRLGMDLDELSGGTASTRRLGYSHGVAVLRLARRRAGPVRSGSTKAT